MEQEVDWQFGAPSALMQALSRTTAVKKELSHQGKLSIYWNIYVPTLTHGQELWAVTKRTMSRIQVAEMRFLRRAAGLSLRDER